MNDAFDDNTRRSHFRLEDNLDIQVRKRVSSEKRRMAIRASRVDAGAGIWQATQLADLSGGGCSFQLPAQALREGDEVDIKVYFPEEKREDPITYHAQIVRCVNDENIFQISCRFMELRDTDQEWIQQYIVLRQREQLKERADRVWNDEQEILEEIAELDQEEALFLQDAASAADSIPNTAAIVEEIVKQKPKKRFRFGDPLPTAAAEPEIHAPSEEDRHEDAGGGEQRRHIRFDGTMPFKWKLISASAFDKAIKAIEQHQQPLPVFDNQYAVFDTERLDASLDILDRTNPMVADVADAFWVRVDSLCAQVADHKKVNLFVPLRQQLDECVHRFANLDWISMMQADVLSRSHQILEDLVASNSVAPQTARRRQREELKRIRNDLRTLKRMDPTGRDGLEKLVETLAAVADKFRTVGPETIFGHRPLDVNLSAGGVAFRELARQTSGSTLGKQVKPIPVSKEDKVAVHIGLPAAPWRWITAFGHVVAVKSLAKRVLGQAESPDGVNVLPPRRIAIEFLGVLEEDQTAINRYLQDQQLEKRRRARWQ
ncbi:PilZ domain-containing protein [Magnetofaba australis]|uniref:PilZ domain-containing protein n=1 Tax=Magnetofaba australis IT-1 TaxID=1434232 RepID=A0A1Y2JZX9_9PROT|nr:PilZ domain-containing protein [Magnetofaba australis]OSM00416.1 hypothetical protein MAIT1_00931 [Magnetofaba australis IT-1]